MCLRRATEAREEAVNEALEYKEVSIHTHTHTQEVSACYLFYSYYYDYYLCVFAITATLANPLAIAKPAAIAPRIGEVGSPGTT